MVTNDVFQWFARHCSWLQPSRQHDHANAAAIRQRASRQPLAVCAIHGDRRLRWLCNRFRLRLVVHLLQRWTANLLLAVGEYRILRNEFTSN